MSKLDYEMFFPEVDKTYATMPYFGEFIGE